MKNSFHAKPFEEVLKNFSTSEKGLSSDEAKKRVEKYGKNELPERGGEHPITIFLKQFRSFLIYILVAAAVISFFAGHAIDTYVITAVILVNAGMGFVQEYKAMKSIDSLRKMIVLYAKVVRDGEIKKIPAKELVPGDVIIMEEGDKIPADARIIRSKNFRTVEASLTGESLPINKDSKELNEKTAVADRRNMVFMGTFAAGGEARAVVTSIGMETEIGKIAESIGKIKNVKGHFEQKTDTLAKQMGAIAGVTALFVFLVGYLIRGFEFYEIFLFTVAALVSGIPEGLPAVMVIVLAIGAHRMAKRNAIIRTLPATETLGVTTVIATDKTGTLTKSTMNVEKIFLPEEDVFDVTGEGWEPVGEFFQKDKKIEPLKNKRLSKFLHMTSICNNAKVEKEEGKYKVMGDPTEAALVVLSEKAGLKKEVVAKRDKRIDDLPFNPELKYRASLSMLIEEDGEKEIYVVGAPEAILSKCSEITGKKSTKKITEKQKKEIREKTHGFAERGMRVLGIAYKKVPNKTEILEEDMVDNLVFKGLVGMRDPIRTGVKEAIEKTKMAGIRVIMKTGDHKDTALAIAKEIGLVGEDNGDYPLAMTEMELNELSESEFKDVVKNVSVFARVTPNMKLKLVETLQEQGETVAMTGDGINDAPALKKADIGIAMGVTGTDVARESSSMVLADDNFVSIVSAVEEGRTVFINTRNSSSFLITTNFAETVSIITSLVLGFPLPLLATQILWLNMVTDTTSAGALAFEPPQRGVLEEPPKKKDENILSKEIIPFMIMMTIIMAILTITVFKYFNINFGVDKARTGAFAVMAFTQLFNFINMRSLKNSIFKIGFFSNKLVPISFVISMALLGMVMYVPFFQNIFRFVNLSLIEISIIFVLSSTVFFAGEIYKRLKFKN